MIKKIGVKYNQVPIAAKAAIWFTICSLLQRSLSLITVPLFTRLLTTEQYGQYSVFQSWLNIITIFATLNLYMGGFNSAMMKYSDKRSQYVSSVQTCATCITLLLFLIYFPFRKYINSYLELNTTLVLIIFIDMLFAPAFQFWAAKQRYEFKYKSLVVVTLLMSVSSTMIALIAVIFSDDKGVARIMAYTLTGAAFGLALYIINIYQGRTLFNKEYWKFAVAFNLPLIPHYLSGNLLNQSDRLMINYFYGTSEVALYSVAYTLGMVMTMLTQSINNSFVPWEYESIKQKKIDEVRKISFSLLILVGGILLLFICFAPEAIFILASDEYMEAIGVLPPVTLSVYFMFLYTLFANIEFYFNKSKYVLIASFSSAGMNIVLNAIFIPSFGYIAAGYTTLSSYIFMCFMHYLFMKKTMKAENFQGQLYDMKHIIPWSALLCVICVLINAVYDYTILRYVFIILLILISVLNRKKIIEYITQLKNL